MKTLETIYKKLNSVEKTELETHKVELGIVDDIEKELNNFQQIRKKTANIIDESYVPIREIEKAINKAKSEKPNVIKSIQNLRKAQDAVEEKVDKARKVAKELGVNIQSIVDFSKYNTLVKLSNDLESDADIFIKFLNKLPKINF